MSMFKILSFQFFYIVENDQSAINVKYYTSRSRPLTKPVDKSASSFWCGPLSFAMAIRILTNQNVSPEVLFLIWFIFKLKSPPLFCSLS